MKYILLTGWCKFLIMNKWFTGSCLVVVLYQMVSEDVNGEEIPLFGSFAIIRKMKEAVIHFHKFP